MWCLKGVQNCTIGPNYNASFRAALPMRQVTKLEKMGASTSAPGKRGAGGEHPVLELMKRSKRVEVAAGGPAGTNKGPDRQRDLGDGDSHPEAQPSVSWSSASPDPVPAPEESAILTENDGPAGNPQIRPHGNPAPGAMSGEQPGLATPGQSKDTAATGTRAQSLARFQGRSLTQIDAKELAALPWELQQEMISALPRTTIASHAQEGLAMSACEGASTSAPTPPPAAATGEPTHARQLHQTPPTKCDSPLVALPSASKLDPAVLRELPWELRRELEVSYGAQIGLDPCLQGTKNGDRALITRLAT